MVRAVFLDRDGVLNRLVFNPATGENESPHRLEELQIFPGVAEPLKALQAAGYLLFLVSNQPSYAKGKTSLEQIRAIHAKLHESLSSWGVVFKEYFYCYHHPDGVVKKYSGVCSCRKPSPFFLLQAKEKYGVDLPLSWMVGDQDRDMECGKAAGVTTVLVDYDLSAKMRGKAAADFEVQDLAAAAQVILRTNQV